jgi:hypothetical protein
MPVLRLAVADSGLAAAAAVVGRFYGEGLLWALHLPLPELIAWRALIPAVRRAENVW